MAALVAFGTNALPTKTAIEQASHDPDPWVRQEAQQAMKALSTVVTKTNGR